MIYNCVDRGSEKCPCILMETGQCYSCTMIQKGKCDCSSLWQGVCPYTEYLQGNKRPVNNININRYMVSGIKSYSPTLSVLKLETPIAFGLKCKELGAFLMLKWEKWFMPISVLQVDEDISRQRAYINLAVNATVPKTIGLLKSAMPGSMLEVKGPFYSGLSNGNIYNKNTLSIVLAKGIAIMPLVNIKQMLGNNLLCFKLDDNKLPEEFIEDYLYDIECESVDFERDVVKIAEDLKEDCGYCYNGGSKPNIFLMVSPYYAQRIIKLTGFNKNRMIMPNHSNMCCGEGYCGSCSYVDEDGITVRKCKCIDG